MPDWLLNLPGVGGLRLLRHVLLILCHLVGGNHCFVQHNGAVCAVNGQRLCLPQLKGEY